MKSKIIQLKKNLRGNKGFSLGELLIAFALLSLVAIGVMATISAGTNLYTTTNKQVNLQYKSQTALAQFQQYFMDCSTGITKQDDDVIYFSNEDTVYAFRLDADTNKVYFASSPVSSAATALIKNKITDPFCSDVSALTIEVYPLPSQDDRAGSVKITLTVVDGERSFSTNQIFSFRNNPVYIRNTDDGSSYLSTLIDTLSGD